MGSAASSSTLPGPTVSGAWLQENLDKVKVVDASWYMPSENRDTFKEYTQRRIPGAVFFGIDHIADHSTSLPHMLPSQQEWLQHMDNLCLNEKDTIICYDSDGLLSAPRVWWTLRAFGAENVAILDGGLPAWLKENRPLDSTPLPFSSIAEFIVHPKPVPRTSVLPPRWSGTLRPELVLSWQQVKEAVAEREVPLLQLVDARSEGRFEGTAPEPRPGLDSGRIPHSLNLFFKHVMDPSRHNAIRSKQELQELFEKSGVDLTKPLACSCGSGVTASVLAYALAVLGRYDVPVYDGAWSEWAVLPEVPIAQGPNVYAPGQPRPKMYVPSQPSS